MIMLRCAFIALFVALVAACGSSPQMADQQVAEEPESRFDFDTSDWSEERLAVEGRFLNWLNGSESLDDALAQGTARFSEVVEEKAAGQQQLEQELRRFVDSSQAPDTVGWAVLRISQTYLHFGCELEGITAPEGLTQEQRDAYDQMIKDLSIPLLGEAADYLGNIESRGIPQWSDQAAQILDNIDPMTDQSCAATADFWLPEDRPTPEERLASAAEGCANDDVAACREALRFASDDEAPKFLVRSCELSPDHCREAAMHFIEQDEPRRADELLNRGCGEERNQFDSCRLQAAYAHPDLSDEYHARCVDGDLLGCVHFHQVSQAADQVDLHSICATTEAQNFNDQEIVESACTTDANANACLAHGAYLRGNQPEAGATSLASALAGDGGDILVGRGMYGMGEPVDKSDQEAELHAYDSDCADGDVDACLAAGQLQVRRGEDPTAYYADACDLGHGAGCYRQGLSIEADDEADELFARGCEYEYGPACRYRALELKESQEADEYHEQIVELLQTTCTDEDQSTCGTLAEYFEERGDDLTNQTCALYYDGLSWSID